MKSERRILAIILTVIFLLSFLPIGVAEAASVDEMKEQEQQITAEGQQLTEAIQTSLAEVNEKYQEIETLKSKVNEAEQTIVKTEEQIADTKTRISRREAIIAERMQAIQMQSSKNSTLNAILSADSFSEVFSIIFAVNVIQDADNEKIEGLYRDKDNLDKLITTLSTAKAQLEVDEVSLEDEVQTMNGQISSLKQKLSENEDVLSSLISTREKEEARIKAEKEAAAKAAAAKKVQVAQSNNANAANNGGTEASQTETETATASTSNPQTQAQNSEPITESKGGQTLTMVATAYSIAQPGLSNYSALGLNLSKNPWCVAVDPSVIKLGSMIEVSGYGIAIAGDTGGDIKGNRIDVHYPTVAQCTNWGRRTVTVVVNN